MSEMDTSFKHLPTSMHRPCNSYVSPIFLPFIGTDLKRIYNGLEAKEKRTYNGGITEARG